MANMLLNKNYIAEAAIAAYRIVKFGASDGAVLQAAASTDLLAGVCESVGPALGERVDVIHSGIADVEFGGTVTRGAKLTSDASGRAVAAAPGAGTNAQIIGFALASQVSGDIGPMMIAPSVMQG